MKMSSLETLGITATGNCISNPSFVFYYRHMFFEMVGCGFSPRFTVRLLAQGFLYSFPFLMYALECCVTTIPAALETIPVLSALLLNASRVPRVLKNKAKQNESLTTCMYFTLRCKHLCHLLQFLLNYFMTFYYN